MRPLALRVVAGGLGSHGGVPEGLHAIAEGFQVSRPESRLDEGHEIPVENAGVVGERVAKLSHPLYEYPIVVLGEDGLEHEVSNSGLGLAVFLHPQSGLVRDAAKEEMVLDRQVRHELFHELQHSRQPRRAVVIDARQQVFESRVLHPKQPDGIHRGNA
jgi:hypothetical protein